MSYTAGILMLQASQHFVSRAAYTDSMPDGASVAAVPADDVAAPASTTARSSTDDKPAAARPRKTRATNGLGKAESDAPAVPSGASAQRVTRSKSAALKREDSEAAPAAAKSKAKR